MNLQQQPPPVSLGTHQKALKINLNPLRYGTFAEIGAGQEVARWFFSVGGAAGTVAKSISAYDMTFSDAVYGTAERYVCKERLLQMLDREHHLLISRLAPKRGGSTAFFTFADTVAAKSYKGNNECHGWMGIRFQTLPEREPNDIIMHVRMLDEQNMKQQEALGIIGVNLVFGAFYFHSQPEKLIETLLDGLTPRRIEVDLIQLSGPDFASVDNRLMSLQLVLQGLTHAAMFAPDGEVLQPSDVFYKQSVLVERGHFRPVTNVHMDMLDAARQQFVGGGEVMEILEMTLKNLLGSGENHSDFLARADLLAKLGKRVLISNFAEFHRLSAYLNHHTQKPLGVVLGISLLKEIFEEKYYTDLEGGILESFGRLFKNSLKLYIYPAIDERSGAVVTADNLEVSPRLHHLYRHLLDSGYIVGLKADKPSPMGKSSRDVQLLIEQGDPAWESMVHPEVAKIIKDRGFFGFGGDANEMPID